MTGGLSANAEEVAAQLPHTLVHRLAPLHGKSDESIRNALNNDLKCGDRACLIVAGVIKDIGAGQFLVNVRLRNHQGTFGKDVIAACHRFVHTEEGRTRLAELKQQHDSIRAIAPLPPPALALL